jgi:hypothetical protein
MAAALLSPDAAESAALPFAGAYSRFDDIGLASGDRIEAPGAQLRDLAREGRVVSIRGLTKKFDTPDGVKLAVDHLDMDMFEGQIFALLGHK